MKALYTRIMDIIGDAKFLLKFNGWAAVFFAVLIIPSLAFGWVNLVVYVSVLSIWALVASHWAGWQSARVEVKQLELEQSQDKQLREMIEEIVQRLDEKTPDPDDK